MSTEKDDTKGTAPLCLFIFLKIWYLYILTGRRKIDHRKEEGMVFCDMQIRRAVRKDIPKINELLGQVLEVHAKIRPDIFIPGTTTYTDEELGLMMEDDRRPIFVAVDEQDAVLGYAFCQLKDF